nr:ribonuclease H-like domain-containing protein [Tanacetum cinerariifolium]
MEARATTTMTAKLPILNPGEYDLWLTRIEQYFLMTDYSLWKVIKNGNKVLTRTVGTCKETYEPTSVEEKLDRRNEIKARGTMLMALPNKDQLKFHSYQDAKLLMEAIEKSISSTNEADTTASGVSTTHTQEDLEQIDPDDLEEMDLHWEMAMLIIRARRAPKNQDIKGREYRRKTVPVESLTKNALIAQDGIRGQVSDKSKAGQGYKEITPNSFVNSSEILEKQENRLDKEYHAVPPPLTGNYMPPKRDLMLIDEHFESVYVDVISNIAPSDVKTVKTIDVNHKDDESKEEISPIVKVKTVKPSIEKIKYVKPARETVKTKESPKQHKHHHRVNQQNWNNLMSQRLGSNFKMINKACYVCGSFEHLQVNDSTARGRAVVSGNLRREVNAVKA